jgi:hypothetical protein
MSRGAQTPDEVATGFRKSPRWLGDWLRANPRDAQGELFFTPVGRDKIFYPADVARIERALRESIPCRSSSGRRALAKRRTTKSAAPTSDSMLRLAADLTNDPSMLAVLEEKRRVEASRRA